MYLSLDIAQNKETKIKETKKGTKILISNIKILLELFDEQDDSLFIHKNIYQQKNDIQIMKAHLNEIKKNFRQLEEILAAINENPIFSEKEVFDLKEKVSFLQTTINAKKNILNKNIKKYNLGSYLIKKLKLNLQFEFFF